MLRQQKGLLPLKALVANNLGCVLRKRQEWSAAGRYHQQSINLYRQIGNKLMLANAIGNFAKLYKLQRRYPEALRYFDEAMALAVQFPDNIWAKERLADFAKNKTELIREMEGIGMTSS
ncbi:MAG: tetratricopeptide repeat protein [Ardenticatenaceae bacterium]|nr:tetratricopeptide repeat protein [Ardenticatenaceae bacterium]MCB9443260.1 tetratricopeptide repeat protein [Ardenticatenaceae bacterium]